MVLARRSARQGCALQDVPSLLHEALPLPALLLHEPPVVEQPVPGEPALQPPPMLEHETGVGAGVGAGVACVAVDVDPSDGWPPWLVTPSPPCPSGFWTAWSPPGPVVGAAVGAEFVPLPPLLPGSGDGVAAELLPPPPPSAPGVARAGTTIAAKASAIATRTTRRRETARVPVMPPSA